MEQSLRYATTEWAVIADTLCLYVTNAPINPLPLISASPNCPMDEDPNHGGENTLNRSIVESEIKSLVTQYFTQYFASNLKLV